MEMHIIKITLQKQSDQGMKPLNRAMIITQEHYHRQKMQIIIKQITHIIQIMTSFCLLQKQIK